MYKLQNRNDFLKATTDEFNLISRADHSITWGRPLRKLCFRKFLDVIFEQIVNFLVDYSELKVDLYRCL